MSAYLPRLRQIWARVRAFLLGQPTPGRVRPMNPPPPMPRKPRARDDPGAPPRPSEGYGGPLRAESLDAALSAVIESDDWSYLTFRRVMIALAGLPGGPYLPAPRCPLSIDLDGWAREASRLVALTAEDGRERGAAVLVDLDADRFVLSPVHTGTLRTVQIDSKLQPGRERQQRIVATLHTHPRACGSQGMSPEDYAALLCEPQLRAALLAWGDQRLLALKTSATPYGQGLADQFKRHIEASRAEWLPAGGYPESHIARFNKVMCVEFGLVLYVGQAASSVVRRVAVTH